MLQRVHYIVLVVFNVILYVVGILTTLVSYTLISYSGNYFTSEQLVRFDVDLIIGCVLLVLAMVLTYTLDKVEKPVHKNNDTLNEF